MFLPRVAEVITGRYRLDSKIAAGGMGEVWRAVDLVLDRPVAVKLLKTDYADHPEALARFRAEARHAAALSHPNIAQIFDYADAADDQPPYLVMQLVNGPPLSAMIADGPLDADRVLDVIGQAAAGLSAAHAAGLIHRDIKPGNLLADANGTVKITDFGIAYATGSAPLTRTGTLIGTPAYLAPERVAGGGAGPASDLYSLGVVAYECLTGAQPFGGTPMEVALSHWHTPLPPLPPQVPPPVAELVADLTAKDPANRPPSAMHVVSRAASLRAAMRNQPAARAAHSAGGAALVEPEPVAVRPAGAVPGLRSALGHGALSDPPASGAAPASGQTPAGIPWLLGLMRKAERARAEHPGAGAAAAVDAAARHPGPPRPAPHATRALRSTAIRLALYRLGRRAASTAAQLSRQLTASARTPQGRDEVLSAMRAAPGPLTALRPASQRHVALLGALRSGSRKRTAVYMAAGLAVVGGLIGGLTAGSGGSADVGRLGAEQQTFGRQVFTATTDRTVDVRAATLAGQPVSKVIRQLHRLGLRVRVTWRRSRVMHRGLVTSVRPAGRIRVGGTVLVTVSAGPPPPARHRHHQHGRRGGRHRGRHGSPPPPKRHGHHHGHKSLLHHDPPRPPDHHGGPGGQGD